MSVKTKRKVKSSKTKYKGIYISESGSYYFRPRITLPDGSTKRPKYTFDTLTEAVLEKELLENKIGKTKLLTEYSLREVASLYLKHKQLSNDEEENIKVASLYNLEKSFESLIYPYFDKGNRLITKITANDINDWKAEINEYYAFNTKKNIFINFKAVFKFAQMHIGLKENPFDKVKSFKDRKKTVEPIKYWTHEQFIIFDDYEENEESILKPYKLFFEVLFYTGIRMGETQALFFTDIDWDHEMLYITKSMNKTPLDYIELKNISHLKLVNEWQKNNLVNWNRITTTKNNSSVRKLDISGFVIEELSKLRNLYKEKIEGFRDDWYIFGGLEPLARTSITRHFERRLKEVDLPCITLHELRHSHATHLISKGFTLFDVAKRLGHSDVQQLMETYGHLLPTVQKKMSSMQMSERKKLQNKVKMDPKMDPYKKRH